MRRLWPTVVISRGAPPAATMRDAARTAHRLAVDRPAAAARLVPICRAGSNACLPLPAAIESTLCALSRVLGPRNRSWHALSKFFAHFSTNETTQMDRSDRLSPMAALCTAVLATQPIARAAETTFATDIGVFHSSNLTNAQYSPDVRPDSAARFGAEVGQFFAPGATDTVEVAAFARGELYRRYHGLDNAVIGARAEVRHKFGVGYQAPWLRLAAEGTHDDYDDPLRDSNRLLLGAELGARYSEAWDVAMGISYDRRYDNHGESLVPGIPGTVFDLRGFGGYARAGYAFNDIVYGALRFGVRRGDVESTAQ